MRIKCSSVFFLCIVVFTSAFAEHLKVDLSVLGQHGGATGFTNWAIDSSITDTHTATFGDITCTIKMVSPSLGRTQYLKRGNNGKDGITYGYKLAFDGIWPHWKPDPPDMPYPNGGAITLTISGLTTGSHNIVTYHNNLWAQGATPRGWDRANNMSKTKIYVDGSYVKTITPTYLVKNDADCGYAFFTVNAVSGTPVVIGFEPDGSGTIDSVILNGFEINAPGDLSSMASEPIPADLDMHVDVGNDNPAAGQASNGFTMLSWTPAISAVSHNVYLGTSKTDVKNATPTTPGIFKGNQTGTKYRVSGLNSLYTYYWRIDEVDSSGTTTPGLVWSFRPRRVSFPGAEGWGRFAIGGRGGKVYHVTNLNDSGPGSLRAGIEAEGPRTIVFDVSGIIDLDSRLILRNPYCTVAGQTAPGKGICIKDYDFSLLGHNDFIIRYMRVRVGKEIGTNKTLACMRMGSSNHAIVDHCSFSWSIDQAFNSTSASNTTLQRTLISETLHVADNKNYSLNESYGFAASIGGNMASFHHNLLAHCERGNWYLNDSLDGSFDIRNNVVYNWDGHTTDGAARFVNFVRNYYKPGPATDGPFTELNPDLTSISAFGQLYYVEGNVMEGHHGPEGPLLSFDGVDPQGTPYPGAVAVPGPLFEHYVTTQSASDAYDNVLADVGCNRPMLDDHDTRIINEVRNGTFTYAGYYTDRPGLIDNQTDAKGWETYPEIHRDDNFDTDGDGLPDDWENARVYLNPSNPADGNEDYDNDGYTNLEDYLNWLAGDQPPSDDAPPIPGPMTWQNAPTAIDGSMITMTAATATDDTSSVEYYFACTTGGGHNSGWQASPMYVDTGLDPGTNYGYQVMARDTSPNANETGWSDEAFTVTYQWACTVPITEDLNGDCQVDMVDYAIFAEQWNNPTVIEPLVESDFDAAENIPCVELDLTGDCLLNLDDLAVLFGALFQCNRDPYSECWQ